MLKFLSRTVYTKNFVRQLYVACDTGFPKPRFDETTHQVYYQGACQFCLYVNDFHTYDEWITCVNKHCCNESQFPFIKMMDPINDEVYNEYYNPNGEIISYAPTGIFRQVSFEGQPYYIQLYVATNSDGKCNSSCWWHAWRLNNKRTWRQCSTTHQCQQNGSLWVLMAPDSPTLNLYFRQQF